jgi:hypothetical protein
LARGYTRERYGDPDHEQSDDELTELTASYRRVRAKLWRQVLLRPVPRRRRSLAVGGSAGGRAAGLKGL